MKLAVKIGIGILVTSQLDSYTYLVSSLRVQSKPLDVATMVINILCSLSSLILSSMLASEVSNIEDK